MLWTPNAHLEFSSQALHSFPTTPSRRVVRSTGFNRLSFNTSSFTPFFASLLDSFGGISDAFVSDPRLGQRLVEAFHKQYGILMAQIMDTAFRQAGESPLNLDLNGTIMVPDRTRLIQDRNSTYALEALLGTMAICALLAWIFGDTRRVLPKNPCSIVALTSLLAGSTMLSQLSTSADYLWCNDRELAAKPFFRNNIFEMRWWGSDSAERRFGIDITSSDSDPVL